MRAVDRTEDELKGAGLGYVLSAIGAVLMSYALARIAWAEVDDLGTAHSSVYSSGRLRRDGAGGHHLLRHGRRALWFINAGYQLLALVIVGAIHGVWD